MKYKLGGVPGIMAVVIRRKWWVLVPFVVLFGLSVLITLIFPSIYVSQTMILIQPREVPNAFVMDLISGTTDQRLMSIQQTILSRTNLLRTLSEFEGRQNDLRDLNDDRKVELLKKRIQIQFVSERRNGVPLPTTNFKILYADRDPDLAQKVTARLASLFIEQDNRNRESQVFGTTEFLTGELAKVQEQLRQSQDNLKTLKERFRFELPNQLETNLRTLDRLQTQKNANVEAMDRYVTMRMNLEQLRSETELTIPRPQGPRIESPALPSRDTLLENYKRKEEEYRTLVAKATERHPDVLRLKAELEQLAKEMPPEDLAAIQRPSGQDSPDSRKDSKDLSPQGLTPKDSIEKDASLKDSDSKDRIPNPAYQNVISQLQQIQTEILIRQRERASVEKEMALYTQRVQDTPRVEQELAAVTRRNDELSKQYEELRVNLEKAKLALSLENRQKGAQFIVVDPANYPLVSASPHASVIFLIGTAISFVLGLVVAVMADVLNQKIWTQHQLETLLGVPVLVEVPKIFSLLDLRRARTKRWVHAMAFALFVGVYGCGIYYLYLKQSRLMTLLNPVIETAIERTLS